MSFWTRSSAWRYRFLSRSVNINALRLTAAATLVEVQRTGEKDPAATQFDKASMYRVPTGWGQPKFVLSNKYPRAPTPRASTTGTLPPLPGPSVPIPSPDPAGDAPWLSIDFRTDPLAYCNIIKEYCWEGNVNNGFAVQHNTVRNWYHAPWMHWGDHGREPINGLTYERSPPPFEFSRTQGRFLQTWACGYYNATGATVFGQVWANPDEPDWSQNVEFQEGTCVFKLLLSDATDQEVPIMTGAPGLQAMIAPSQADPSSRAADPKTRNDYSTTLRLFQVDFAVRDKRSENGWVFGTFMYNGQLKANAWDRLTAVGIMWGNDKTLDQDAFDKGARVQQSWINPEAEKIRRSLGGKRPSWGWNGRLNGPADNFISSCASCHSTAQIDTKTKRSPVGMTPPMPNFENGRYIPKSDPETMGWFQDVEAGKPFSSDIPTAVSGDYSLQLMLGYGNYQSWKRQNPTTTTGRIARSVKMIPGKVFGFKREDEDNFPPRQGPDIRYDKD